MNSMLKILKGTSVECMECLNKDAKKKKKKDRSCTSQVGTIKSLPVPHLDITHESYGFNADLIKAIN